MKRVSELIYWFYTEYVGEKPDSTIYASHTNMFKPLLTGGKHRGKARTYTLDELKGVLEELYGSGEIDPVYWGMRPLLFPGLVADFLSGDEYRKKRQVEYLKGEQPGGGRREQPPPGW